MVVLYAVPTVPPGSDVWVIVGATFTTWPPASVPVLVLFFVSPL